MVRHFGALVLCAVLLGAGGEWSLSQANATLSVSHEARSLQPGEVLLITVRSSHRLTRVSGQAYGRQFLFYGDADGRVWNGLLGIDLDAPAGQSKIQIQGTMPDGRPVQTGHAIAIRDKQFPTRRLTVDEKFVNPPPEAMERINAESRLLQALFQIATPERMWDGPFVAPVSAPLGSPFGLRSIFNNQPRSPHAGTDFRAPSGTPIKAPNAGVVVLAADLYYAGNTVILDHGHGLYSYFAHLSRFDVTDGARVRTGTVIGRVGATGRVTGAHLHWSVRLAGARVDPMALLEVMGGKPPAK